MLKGSQPTGVDCSAPANFTSNSKATMSRLSPALSVQKKTMMPAGANASTGPPDAEDESSGASSSCAGGECTARPRNCRQEQSKGESESITESPELDECGSAMRSTMPMYVCTPVGSTVCLRLLNFVCKGMRRSCNACSPPAPPSQIPRAHPPCSNAPQVSQIYLFLSLRWTTSSLRIWTGYHSPFIVRSDPMECLYCRDCQSGAALLQLVQC